METKPVKIDHLTQQALKEYAVFLQRDMGAVIRDALLKNPAFKRKYDEVKRR